MVVSLRYLLSMLNLLNLFNALAHIDLTRSNQVAAQGDK
jgi:hypothetical protein